VEWVFGSVCTWAGVLFRGLAGLGCLLVTYDSLLAIAMFAFLLCYYNLVSTVQASTYSILGVAAAAYFTRIGESSHEEGQSVTLPVSAEYWTGN